MSTLRRMGHRITDADGCVVDVMDLPTPSAAAVARERLIDIERDIGMVDADGRTVTVGDWVEILDGGDGIVANAGIVAALINEDGIRARVQDRRSDPAWGAWCMPTQIRKVTKAKAQRMMRAS